MVADKAMLVVVVVVVVVAMVAMAMIMGIVIMLVTRASVRSFFFRHVCDRWGSHLSAFHYALNITYDRPWLSVQFL